MWSLDNKRRSSVNLYGHDSKGNIVSAYREFSDGMTSTEVFIYDSFGNKTTEYFYRSDSVSGSASYQYKDNQLSQAIYSNHKGLLNGLMKYEYNDNDQLIKAELTNDGKVVCKVIYSYDCDKNLSGEYWDFQGKWNQYFQYFYERKDINKTYYSSPFLSNTGRFRISKERYTFNDEKGGPSYYEYDREDLLKRKVFNRSDSVSTTTFYEYDDEKRLISSKRIYSDGSIARFTYTYNENDKLVLRVFYKADTLFGFESYQYHSDGGLNLAYYKNYDSWLSGTLVFHYKNPGKIEYAEFKGEDGFDARINFTYNEEKLVSEIKWDFSFGKFQKYNFEYGLKGSP